MLVLLEAVRSGARTGDDVRRFLDQLGRERQAVHGVTGLISFSLDGDVQRDPILRRIPAPDAVATNSP